MRFTQGRLFPLLLWKSESEIVHAGRIQETLDCLRLRTRNVAIVYPDTSLFIVSSHSHQYNHIIRSCTEFILLLSLTLLYLCLLPTASNTEEHYDILISFCFQLLLPFLWFPPSSCFSLASYFLQFWRTRFLPIYSYHCTTRLLAWQVFLKNAFSFPLDKKTVSHFRRFYKTLH